MGHRPWQTEKKEHYHFRGVLFVNFEDYSATFFSIASLPR